MDRTEFADIALSHLEDVTSFAHYLTDTEWEAEDLVQTTDRKAFERWDSLSNPGRCRSWLFQIARNEWRDWLRSRDAGPDLTLVDPRDPRSPRSTVSPDSIEQLDERQVRAGLEKLSEPKAEALVLCDIWGFSYEEIAEIIDTPLGTVRSRISRARTALLDVIESFDEAGESGHST